MSSSIISHRQKVQCQVWHYKGEFARVIDFKVEYAQSLIDDFSSPDQTPYIATSVDTLDTGIDVPEIGHKVSEVYCDVLPERRPTFEPMQGDPDFGLRLFRWPNPKSSRGLGPARLDTHSGPKILRLLGGDWHSLTQFIAEALTPFPNTSTCITLRYK